MDRSFHNSPLIGKSPFSPRARQSFGAKRTVVITPSAFRKSSRLSVSGKSAQSVQVILKSNHNCVERFGQPLPVLITEALTFADRNIVVSARISECGYAWVVCGRRLLVWQYRHNPNNQYNTPQKKSIISNQCFELQLPQSDLAHRAELISVFVTGTSHIPSCIAVSPEGLVRYWPAVTHEGVSVEQIVDLQGQECDSLTNIGEFGCVLATTTCSVVLVQPCLNAGRHSMNCHPLRPPTGWLGGLSKRMSSFIFGPMSSEQSAETRLVRVLSVKESDHTWMVYVLAGHSLQKWKMSTGEAEQLVFVAELTRFVQDGFQATVWENCGGDQTEIDTWLLDIQADSNNIIILAAAVNMHVTRQMHYALVSVQTNTTTPPTNIKDFLVLKMNGLYREDNMADSLAYRFLLCGTSAYIYNQRSIIVVKPQEEPDTLEFNSSQDFLLGGSICVNTPVFFSRNYGLVAVTSNDLLTDLNASSMSMNLPPLDASFNESITGNLSIYNMDADEIYNMHKDTIGKLKAAFIYHIKNQQNASQDILHELFLSEAASSIVLSVDAVLDKVVLEICEELLDDVPAGDPRWSHETSIGLGSSYSMQVIYQLQDKQKALGLFVRFLQETELWNRLVAVVVRDTTLATAYVIGECFEKLVAAICLKNTAGNSRILEKAIVELYSKQEIEGGLTRQDVFFREVTKVHALLRQMVNTCEDAAHSDCNPAEIVALINETNALLLVVLKDVIQQRQRNIDNYNPQPSVLSLAPDYLPWTAASGPQGLNDALILQQSLTCNYGARVASDTLQRNILYDQLVSLIDIILDGQKSHFESIRNTSREGILLKQYQVDRHKYIAPLVEDKQWERAAVLAEKYLDFETLVVICESTNNQQRLDEYMDRFNNEGFSEFVYSWYLQENQSAKLINRCRSIVRNKNNQKLTTFLADHPSLSWLQNIFDKKYGNAARILRNLGQDETDLVVRQKTMFSLSKLANLAAPDGENEGDFNEYIDSRLELIAFQEDLPDYVLLHYGYDTVKPRVIPPKDLIHLYTCAEYKEATEVEFKKALDLLEFIDEDQDGGEEQRNVLSLGIWRAAILRDSWLDGNIDSPLEILQNTLFFKLVDLALCLGSSPQTLLPPLDALMDSPELEDLQESKNFQYLLKAGYEHVFNM